MCASVFFLPDEEMISSVRAICAGVLNDKLRVISGFYGSFIHSLFHRQKYGNGCLYQS